MRSNILLACAMLMSIAVNAQQKDWQHKDLEKDSVFGISTEKAYKMLLAGKKSTPVAVAVIDSGVDTTHEDLRAVLWKNEREIPGNGIDDDHNGYIDDIHGWNFIGEETGKEDITRLGTYKKDFFDSLAYVPVPASYLDSFRAHKLMSDEYYGHLDHLRALIADMEGNSLVLDSIVKKIAKEQVTVDDFLRYKPANKEESIVLTRVINELPKYRDFQAYRKYEIDDLLKAARFHIAHGLNPKEGDIAVDPIGGGNSYIQNDPAGLGSAVSMTGLHGTHVAGIIGAIRNNGIGMDGVADNVRIMVLKTNGNIRELRDRNLASAIRYAADNGAKVINMSLGKYYVWDKDAVDQAVKYAMQKDVLIVSAAMNNALDRDKKMMYPNRQYKTGGMANAWIVVGASGPHDDSTLIASFSNYGKTTVDVFAPGVQVFSTIPGSKYESWDGTSMASPAVAGLAALIREYYPMLSAVQVKEIIMKSVVRVNHPVRIEGDRNYYEVKLSDICVSGGIVNAYNALLLASQYK